MSTKESTFDKQDKISAKWRELVANLKSDQIGTNNPDHENGRRQFVIVANDNEYTLVANKLFEMGNKGEKWLNLSLFKATGVLNITNVQARWLVDTLTLRHKYKGVALKDITPK